MALKFQSLDWVERLSDAEQHDGVAHSGRFQSLDWVERLSDQINGMHCTRH